MTGKSSAGKASLLAEGLRCEKAGLLDRALALYEEARRDSADLAVLSESWRLEAFARHGRCEWEASLAAARRSGELALEAGRSDLAAEALNAEAAVHLGRGDMDRAEALFEEMLALTDDHRVRGLAHQNLAIVLAQRGELDEAESWLREAYRSFEEAEYRWGRAHVLNNTVGLRLERRDFSGAEALSHQAVREAQLEGDLDLLAIATLNYAEALAGLGQHEAAEIEASSALGHFNMSGNRWRRVACFRILGDMHALRDDRRTARSFWKRGLELAMMIGAERDVALLEERLAESADDASP